MDTQVEYGDEGVATLRIAGDLDVRRSGELHAEIERLAGRTDLHQLVLDFSSVDRLDSSGIAVISLASVAFGSSGKSVEVRNLRGDHRAALDLMPARPAQVEEAPRRPGLFERLGEGAMRAGTLLLSLAELVVDLMQVFGLALVRRRRLPRGAFAEQAVRVGVDALFIIALLSFLLGLIMAFQSAFHLSQFGANIYVADLVGLSMTREFGPMMTGIMLAGRSGSAIAAEIATMTVQEEVDALKTMGIDPVRFLAAPRLLALTVVQPALTLIADFVGILGGFLIATLLLDLSVSAYVQQTLQAVSLGDFGYGLVKSVVFAWIIGITGCYTGLTVRGGASSVGTATTRAVVAGIFFIIVADSLFATMSTLLK